MRVLFACVFVVMTGYGITLTVLPYYVDRVHGLRGLAENTVAFHVGLLTAVYALAQLAASPAAGHLGDRLGRRPVLLGGLAGMAVTQALFAVTPWLWAMYLLRVLGGAATSGMLVAATSFVADATPPAERAGGMAWFGTSMSLGLVAGPALGGLLSQSSVAVGQGALRIDGFSLPFLAAALLAVAVLAAARRLLPESRPGMSTHAASEQAATTGVAQGRPGLRSLLGLVACSQFGLALFEGTFVVYGRDRLALTPGRASAAFMVCGLVMSVLQLVAAGPLARVMSPVSQVAAGLILMGVGIAALAATLDFLVVLAWIGLFASGMALVTPNLAALISLRNGRRTGTALGMKSAAGNAGQFVGPVVGTFLLGWRAASPFMVASATLLAAGIAVAVGAAGRGPRVDHALDGPPSP